MAIAAQSLRNGTLFSDSGKIYCVINFHHHKMGRGKAVIRVKVKDIESGGVRELTFNNNSTVEEVDIVKKNMEFVYRDERKGVLVFSDPESKSRLTLETSSAEGMIEYLVSGVTVQAMVNEQGEIITFELPNVVNLEVEETGPSDKGDTAGAARKPATMTTGLVVQVPMFISVGDVVKVNTQSGEYKERVS